MSIFDKRNKDRQQQHLKKRRLTGKFFDTFKGVIMNVLDATGREIKKGQIVQVPREAFPDLVANMEVVDIREGSVIDTPGVPKRPPVVILAMTLVVPVNPMNSSVPYCYIIGERRRAPTTEEAKDVKLESEQPPEGIVLTDETKPS